MKIKYAVQILSNHVAAGMCTQMSSGFLSSEAVGTIDFINPHISTNYLIF